MRRGERRWPCFVMHHGERFGHASFVRLGLPCLSPAMALLDRLFAALIRAGPLTLLGSDGRKRTFGAPRDGLKPVTIRLSGRGTEGRILRNPALGFGEAYMDGRLTIEDGDIRDLLELVAFNLAWEEDG